MVNYYEHYQQKLTGVVIDKPKFKERQERVSETDSDFQEMLKIAR